MFNALKNNDIREFILGKYVKINASIRTNFAGQSFPEIRDPLHYKFFQMYVKIIS